MATVLLASLLLSPSLQAQASGSSRASSTSRAADDGVAARTPLAQVGGRAHVQLAIATRALQRGDTVRAGDYVMVDSTITWRWSMPASDSALVQPGWVVQRVIAEGEALRAPAVQPPALIAGGSAVKVIYRDGPVQIVLAGTAITSATLGESVSVRIDRGRRVEGFAIAPNTVQLR